MPVRAIIFDAYGTLFDVYSIGALAERLFPGKGTALAELWRDKQIQYSQLRTLCSTYKPFWEVTQDALVFSCRKLGLDLNLEAQNMMMGQYAKLQPFPENLAVLRQLKATGMKLAILSNGNPEMLAAVVHSARMEDLFSHVISVDAVRKFKTAPEAYQLGTDLLGMPPRDIVFVSSNGWDVCGASWFGYKTFWVNRAGAPMEELGVTPHGQGPLLSDLPAFIAPVLPPERGAH
ncbi:MAG: haloacid dehalogenase type II [Noviherbaspirillum sp.]